MNQSTDDTKKHLGRRIQEKFDNPFYLGWLACHKGLPLPTFRPLEMPWNEWASWREGWRTADETPKAMRLLAWLEMSDLIERTDEQL